MKLTKIIPIVLSFTLLVGTLVGCASNSETNGGTSSTAATQNTASESSNAASETAEDETGKVLVVYYSTTGNTEAVANTTAETLNADTFELVPVKPYTSEDLNWSNNDSRVSKEHDNPDSRNVELTSVTVDNWDSYDTVFIGYPIWWGIAAWPVDSFVKSNDFTGKTVIPFCTSSSSDIGESGKLLSEKAGTGDWKEGGRFRSGASDEDVSTWAKDAMQ